MHRLRLAALALLCLGFIGCVEGGSTITVNPDGSAKIRIEVVTISADPGGGGSKKQNDETIPEMLRAAIRQTLQAAGIDAWKDVSAEFLPNGKLKFSGVAYVRQIKEFRENNSMPLFVANVQVTRDSSGALELINRNEKGDSSLSSKRRKQKSPDELRKMTDAELDDYIMADLIELQSARPLMLAACTDLRIKNAFVMPGEITEISGFVKDGRTAVFEIDGNAILGRMSTFLTMSPADRRKLFREAKTPHVVEDAILGALNPGVGKVKVANPTGALFDYDTEVKAARAAYPELRKRFGFGDDLNLPTGGPPAKK